LTFKKKQDGEDIADGAEVDLFCFSAIKPVADFQCETNLKGLLTMVAILKIFAMLNHKTISRRPKNIYMLKLVRNYQRPFWLFSPALKLVNAIK
jgi:hypothetical protein